MCICMCVCEMKKIWRKHNRTTIHAALLGNDDYMCIRTGFWSEASFISREFHDDDERLFITSSTRNTGTYISSNDLKYKNLFTIIWDNFGEKEEREKNCLQKNYRWCISDLAFFFSASVCITSQRYWQWRSLILIFIIAFFFLL